MAHLVDGVSPTGSYSHFNYLGSGPRQGLNQGGRKLSSPIRGSKGSWICNMMGSFILREVMVTGVTLGTGVLWSHVTWSSTREERLLSSSSS